MAFFQEPDRQPFLRVPASTVGLLAALVLAHLARVMAPPELSQSILFNFAFFPARYSHAFLAAHHAAPQTLWDQAVPFVSYIFIHANFTHLAINCVWLLPFGTMAARRLGAFGFCFLFLLCGMAGAFAHLLSHWGSMIEMIGASAAISGTMGTAFRIIAWPGLSPEWLRLAAMGLGPTPPLAPLFSRRVVVWSALWIAINVFAGLTGLGTGPTAEPIAWQAHIGGYLAGLLLAGPLDRFHRRLAPRLSGGD